MRFLERSLFTLTMLGLIGWLFLSLSVWPGAMLVRVTFKAGGEKTRTGLIPYERDDVQVITDEAYLPHDPDAVMDIYLPVRFAGTGRLLPVIVWTHGGGWIGGDKSEMRGYLMQLAHAGYVVVAPNYGRAPEHRYPAALRQINAAMAHITTHAVRLHADMERVFMAGDSAGAQLTAQIAAISTNPLHATQVGITPALRPEQVRGLILHCGLYDMPTYVERGDKAGPLLGYMLNILPWAYLGEKHADVERLRAISPILHATPAYPPVFISGGNGDPLTAHQSLPMAKRLKELGVSVTELFFANDHEPALPHEYQFMLSGNDAQRALSTTLSFLSKHSS